MKKCEEAKAGAAEMHMLRRMCSVFRRDKIRNKYIRSNFWVITIGKSKIMLLEKSSEIVSRIYKR